MPQILTNLAKGMVRKTNNLKKDPQSYNFALNISTSKNIIDRLTRVTENKLEDYYSLKNQEYIILNSLYLNIDEYVYFITNITGSFSEIIHYNKGSIVTKYNNNDLNFKPSSIISSTYRINYNGDRIIYFVDGINNDRVFNLDKILLTDNIESLNINPIYSSSNYLDYDIESSGGNLKAGSYSVFISYNDKNGKESPFKEYIENIPLGNGKYTTKQNYIDSELSNYDTNYNNNFEVYGLPEDSNTFKSIVIHPNTNDNFSTINIYVILKTDTKTEVYVNENVSIDDNIIISNLSNYVLLGSDITNVIVDNLIYNNSETIVQKDNRLILANTKPESYNYNFQDIANNIKVRTVSNKQFFDFTQNNGYALSNMNDNYTAFSSHSANATHKDKQRFSDPNYLSFTQSIVVPDLTFMRDEVYALGVYFELSNGAFTDVYHIPGRTHNPIEPGYNGSQDENGRAYSVSMKDTWDTGEITINDETDLAWKISNTAFEDVLGYHRTDIVYPDGYGYPTNGEKNSDGKSYIRHHRIPSEKLFPLIETTNVTGGTYGPYIRERNYINLKFDNILIPLELQDKIKNIFFCSAERDNINNKVIDKGLAYTTRKVVGAIRNSELLNNPLYTLNNSKRFFEFTSPTVDFKFKNFNIKADRIKSSSNYSGYVGYMIKKFPDRMNNVTSPAWAGFYPASFINSEGINPSSTNQNDIKFDFKQELILTRAFYNSYKETPTVQYKLNDIVFADNNSTISLNGVVNLEGSQNTVVMDLGSKTYTSTPEDFFPGDNFASYIDEDYQARFPSTKPGELFDNFYYPESDVNMNYDRAQRNMANRRYFDSTRYVTLLSDNNNLFTNILQLRYQRLIKNSSDSYNGDCFIENHHTKKSYSTLVNNADYVTLNSDYKVKDTIGLLSLPANFGDMAFVSSAKNLDMAVSETYITYPVETRMNIRMRRNDGDYTHFPYNMFKSNYPYNVLEKKALSQEVYQLDDEFKNIKTIKPLFSNNIKLEDLITLNKKVGNRLIYSELQNNESSLDNFRRFLPNNYKDIATNKGNITKLFIKNNNLYIITRDSLFVINSSNQYLTTKGGSEIYVGSGEFFGSEPEELISLETGFSGTSSKLSFYETKYGYLFVDIIRNKIMLFTDTLNDINLNGLYEEFELELYKYFPELNDNLDKPLLGYGVLSGFDPETERIFITKFDYIPTELMLSKYNSNLIQIKEGLFYEDDILISFSNKDYFENKSFTVTFDSASNTWISYHNYFPNYYIPNPKILTVKLDEVSKYSEDFADKFMLDVTLNENFNIVKVFDSLKFDIKSEDKYGNTNNDFFDIINVYTDNQSTGDINLKSIPFSNNLTKKETYWNFNLLLDNSKEQTNNKLFTNDWLKIQDDYFIDKVLDNDEMDYAKPWNKKHRIRDKFINIRLTKNNINNNKFYINFIIANIRQSIR